MRPRGWRGKDWNSPIGVNEDGPSFASRCRAFRPKSCYKARATTCWADRIARPDVRSAALGCRPGSAGLSVRLRPGCRATSRQGAEPSGGEGWRFRGRNSSRRRNGGGETCRRPAGDGPRKRNRGGAGAKLEYRLPDEMLPDKSEPSRSIDEPAMAPPATAAPAAPSTSGELPELGPLKPAPTYAGPKAAPAKKSTRSGARARRRPLSTKDLAASASSTPPTVCTAATRLTTSTATNGGRRRPTPRSNWATAKSASLTSTTPAKSNGRRSGSSNSARTRPSTSCC